MVDGGQLRNQGLLRVSKEEVKAAMKRIEAKKMVSPDDLCGGGDVYERAVDLLTRLFNTRTGMVRSRV